MNLKEYAEQEGISLAEAKERTGLTHWKQDVSGQGENPVAAPVAKSVSETIFIETESKQELSEEAKFSIFILGNKSPHWKK